MISLIYLLTLTQLNKNMASFLSISISQFKIIPNFNTWGIYKFSTYPIIRTMIKKHEKDNNDSENNSEDSYEGHDQYSPYNQEDSNRIANE